MDTTNDDFDDYEINTRYWDNWTAEYWENLDTSKYPFPNTLWHVKSPKEVAIKTTLMLLVGITGLFLNFIIVFIIFRNKWLWTSSNYLIGNMALIDFLTLLCCPWFMLVRDFYQNFVLQHFGCRFEGAMQASLLLAGVCAMILVSYDRLAAAALTAEARITKNVAPKLIIASWILSVLLSIPWAIKRTYVERHWLDYLETFCVEDAKVLGVYWHFTLNLLVWVPLGLMLVTYGAIMWRLECSARQLSAGGGRTVARVRGRAVRITACVLLAGAVCRLPYTAIIYWRNNMVMQINAVDGSFSTLWFAANYLMYTNCAINPLIYGFTNTRFRKAMDRTPPLAWFKFGSWCCVCNNCNKKTVDLEDKNTEKIFVIENSPRPNKKLKQVFKNILHINKESLEVSNKHDEVETKPTKCTPIKTEQV